MKHPLLLLWLVLLSLSAFSPQSAAEEHLTSLTQTCRCGARHAAAPGLEPGSTKKYAPDRPVDLLHLKLEITPNFEEKSIRGAATLRFKPLHKPLSELRLDAVRLSVSTLQASPASAQHRVTDEEIIVQFSPPLPPDVEASVTIKYQAQPAKGLYFRTQAMGYSHSHLWTQGETIESRHWFPSIDHPVEKFTSELLCSVPPGMVALSNGRQISANPGPDGLTTFHWLQEKPHVNYLITLVAGPFQKLEERHGAIPLEFWTLPADFAQAPNSFRHTREIMKFFEDQTGVPYPWAKYGQVTVQDYHWGGMENTSLTTLNDRTLFQTDTETITSSDSLVAHELAHQWFGDLVTCKDWSHIWLNEGFATYYDWLWQGHHFGPRETQLALHSAARAILANTNETRGIVWRKFTDPGEMFNYLAYPKGAWVLHMLRQQVGDALYKKAIRTYLEKHAYGSVTSEDLRAVFEQLSGRSLDRFFDQWLLGVGAPALDIAFDWDQKQKLAHLNVKQTQKITEDAPLFHVDVPVRFVVNGKPEMRSLKITGKEEDFYFPFQAAPTVVRIDPEVTVLAKVTFKPARPMLEAQIQDTGDFLGQIHAIEHLGEKPDARALSLLEGALQNAEHYAVRAQAAETLRKVRSEESLAALLRAGKQQSDARVRNAVTSALGGFFSQTARAQLLKIFREEKNPAIRATALRGLAMYPDGEVEKALKEALQTASYRDRIPEAALATIKGMQNPGLIPALLDFARQRTGSLQTPAQIALMEALADLGKLQPNKTPVREYLTAQLENPKDKVRTAALTALGTLADARAMAVVESFTRMNADKPEKAAAEKALEKIRSERNAGPEMAGLRTELMDLKKDNQDLRKRMETLQKKVEALTGENTKLP